MIIMTSKSARSWAHRMTNVLLHQTKDEYFTIIRSLTIVPGEAAAATSKKTKKQDGGDKSKRNIGSSSASKEIDDHDDGSQRKMHKKSLYRKLSSFLFNPIQNPDLRRFLEEVGTDPREARYWLNQFQLTNENQFNTFAVIEIDSQVFNHPDMMEKLCSSLSFLHRHEMHCIIVLGYKLPEEVHIEGRLFKEMRNELREHMLELSAELETHGAIACPVFPGCNLLTADDDEGYASGNISCNDTSVISWAFQSGHIPIVQSIAESHSGQLMAVNVQQSVAAITQRLQPRKVLLLNTTGGFKDQQREVIANVNLCPYENKHETSSWYKGQLKYKVDYIERLLGTLPRESSVVVTSADRILVELFSHHGSGTLFKVTEPIYRYKNLDSIDKNRLLALINRSFGKELKSDYFEKLEKNLDTLFLSEDYNAAAIITKSDKSSLPYLDKFAVSLAKQGEGFGEMLWDSIKTEFTHLYWRSKLSNKINPWYFKRCTGSTRQGDWIIFWYGLSDHMQSVKLIDSALGIPSSFLD